MEVYMSGYSEDKQRVTSFHGEVGAGGLGMLVRGALSVKAVDFVLVAVWRGAEIKEYRVEKDCSWCRL